MREKRNKRLEGRKERVHTLWMPSSSYEGWRAARCRSRLRARIRSHRPAGDRELPLPEMEEWAVSLGVV